jgi:hypothetical protein
MKKIRKINYNKLKHRLLISMIACGFLIFLFAYHIPQYNSKGKHSNVYGGQAFGFKKGEENMVHFVTRIFS